MINLKMMPEKTQGVFEILSQRPELNDFTLIGGTALSIQLHHRLSEDLDFCLFSEKLNSPRLDYLIQHLMNHHRVQLMTSAAKITQAKINGFNLLDISRDYMINGVKVTFFARADSAYSHFGQLEIVEPKIATFNVMTEASIFTMKSWLLQHRIKSRDLFDLMSMIKLNNRSIEDVFNAVKSSDISTYSEELIKNALIGVLPIDAGDEGFESIGLNVSIGEIYDFFKSVIDDYEVTQAQTLLKASQQATEAHLTPSGRKLKSR